MKFVDLLKGQLNSLNLILLLAIATSCCYWFRKIRMASVLLALTLLSFLLCSTSFVPVYLTKKLEHEFPVFDRDAIVNADTPVYILVLGGGYTADQRLVPLQQLSWSTLGRLAEGIRIHRIIPKSRIITSGYASSGELSLAAVGAEAGNSLGVDLQSIDTLSAPTTTLEEALACKNELGTDINLVLVTDAIHMPRAMRFFVGVGFHPVAAPTNFLIKEDDNISFSWWPSSENMLLSDRILREWFAQLKNSLTS